MLTIKEALHWTNRGVEGFVRSLFAMMGVPLPVPDHSTLSRRGARLQVKLPKRSRNRLNIVWDSTGLKIYGEGEWKVRKHGYSKRRTWRKLPLGSNPERGERVAVVLMENSVSEDAVEPRRLAPIEETLVSCAGDAILCRPLGGDYKAWDGSQPSLRLKKSFFPWEHIQGNYKARFIETLGCIGPLRITGSSHEEQ